MSSVMGAKNVNTSFKWVLKYTNMDGILSYSWVNWNARIWYAWIKRMDLF